MIVSGSAETLSIWAPPGPGATRLEFKDNRLIGTLARFGRIDLEQSGRGVFCDRPSPGSGGEFRLQLRWQLNAEADRWDWTLHFGLPGLRGKGGGWTYALRRSD